MNKKVYKRELTQFALLIKEARIKQGISQTELAGRMDLDVRTIKRIESSKYNPSLKMMLHLSEMLKISFKEIF